MSDETRKYDNLVTLARKSDRGAQKALFELFSGKMMSVCLRYVQSRDEAEDLLHDGFIKVFDAIGKFQYQSTLETWMKRIFINLCINYVTRGKNKYHFEELPEQLPDDTDNVQAHILDKMTLDEVLECIQMLPEKYRVVINMYAIDGLSHAEIGSILSITEGSSKSRLSRSRALLSEIIQDKLKNK